MQSVVVFALLVASAQAFIFGNLGLPNLFGGNACDPCAAAAAQHAYSAPVQQPYYAPPPPVQQYSAPAPVQTVGYAAAPRVYQQPAPAYNPEPVATYNAAPAAPAPVSSGYVQPPPPPPPSAYATGPASAGAVDGPAAGYKKF